MKHTPKERPFTTERKDRPTTRKIETPPGKPAKHQTTQTKPKESK